MSLLNSFIGRFCALVSQHAFLDCINSTQKEDQFLFFHFDKTTQDPVVTQSTSTIQEKTFITAKYSSLHQLIYLFFSVLDFKIYPFLFILTAIDWVISN